MSQPAPHAEAPTAELRVELNGAVIAPEDPTYDEARAVFYTGFAARRPALVARVADANDVSRVVSVARDAGLELAVRSGGHSGAGHGTTDDGIVIDLSQMRSLDIDADSRTAWAETGLTAGEYATATGARGLGTGFGDAPSVGIGGITLGGGVGFLVRRHGLTIDDLLAAEIVTADGELVRVDAETDPDLFWALRGGGGNFGVATRLQFRLHGLDGVVGGMLMLPASADVIASFVAAAEAAPEELSTVANVMRAAPPMPFVPEEHRGRPALMVLMVHDGDGEAGERAVAPFRALAEPIVDMVRPMRYPEMYELTKDAPHPAAATARTMFVDALERPTAETILEHLEKATAPMAVTQIRVLGGAIARVPADATAFAHRGRRIMVNVAAAYEDPGEAALHEAWASEFAGALPSEPGAYVGFLTDEGEARVREAYPGPTWDRLAEIKRRYDPTNLFRLNQNISPAAE
jgi:FAD/FMN-containing dehydrogenase